MPRTTETMVNGELAKVLRTKHPRWKDRVLAEQTNVLTEAAGLRPDIIVQHQGGLPVSIETEYAPANTVENDAHGRLGKTLTQTGDRIEQAIAVRLPNSLAVTSQDDLEQQIRLATYELCVLSGDPTAPARWPQSGWLPSDIDDLARTIELAALSENRLEEGMGIFENGIRQAAGKLRDATDKQSTTLDDIAEKLHQAEGLQTSRMAMAIVANALTFHTSIAGTHGIQTLDQLRNARGKLSKANVLRAWRHILLNVNYWPIFKIASDILLPVRNGTAQEILDILALVASDLDSLGATSHNDLSGRMLQRLITDRKFLATFYTLPTSSALLAELTVPRLNIDWSNGDAITNLKIGDFACGTGALVNGIYQALLSQYRRTGQDDQALHPAMMEDALVATDIMPAATHITASVISSNHPSTTFGSTSVATLPYGEQTRGSAQTTAIGALDLIESQTALPLFATGQQRLQGKGQATSTRVDIPHSAFDIVIMNPPFTRSTGHEAEKRGVPAPAFAGFDKSDDEMKLMAKRLKAIYRGSSSKVGHGNAGLASHFVDLAHAKVKEPDGIIALVLPAACVQGKAWALTRELLGQHYTDITVVALATTGSTDRAFSSDTGMAEVLVVATRKRDTALESDSVLYVNLTERPTSILAAVAMAGSITGIPSGRTAGKLQVGTQEAAGWWYRGTLSDTGAAGLRAPTVFDAATGLLASRLQLPRQQTAPELPLTQLSALGTRGPYHMDISGKEVNKQGLPRGPFDIVAVEAGAVTTWPALWAHDATRETTLVISPDSQGEVRPDCDDKATDMWERSASRLHFTRDFQINSQPLAACITREPVIGGRAWPSFQCDNEQWEKPLAMWANTTLGLICFWWIGTRQQEGRASVTISKLPDLTVLDTTKLTKAQLEQAQDIFETFEDRALLPANEAWHDCTRQALDQAILVDLLQLPEAVLEPLSLLRRQWCAEPSVRGTKTTGPT